MCKFCEEMEKDGYATLIEKENNCGVFGKLVTGIMGWYVDDSFYLETSSTGVLTDINEATVKINYCPMCGRKLVK